MRRLARQPGFQNLSIGDCKCSGQAGSAPAYSGAQQGAHDLGAALGQLLFSQLLGSPQKQGPTREEVIASAIRRSYGQLITEYRSIEERNRRAHSESTSFDTQPHAAWIIKADATDTTDTDADLAAQCPAGYARNFNTRRFVGCCPGETPVLSVPQSFVLNDMVCGSPEAIADGVECLCYASVGQCRSEGSGTLCGMFQR